MADEGSHRRIEQLVAEEHKLYERGTQGGLSSNAARVRDPEVVERYER